MRRITKITVSFLLILVFSVTVSAETAESYVQEQLEASGATELWEQLDAETKGIYEQLGIENVADLMHTGVDTAGLLDAAGELLREQGRTPFTVMGVVLAAVVLCAYAGGLKDAVGGNEINGVYQTVCVLAVCTVAAVPFTACLTAVNDALSGVAVFMGSFSPVYVAAIAANGNISAAFSYQTVLLLVSQLLGFLTGGVLLPLLTAAMAMGVISASTDSGNVGKIGEMLLKTVSWALGTVSALFTALLTVNGMLGAAGDSLGSRIAKLSLAGMVPVVGGALSEAFLTVKGCIGVATTTIGAFGTITTALLLLPTLIRCFCWQLSLWVCVTAAEVFEVKGVAGMLKILQQVNKHMIALLSISGLFMLIATIVVSRGTAV